MLKNYLKIALRNLARHKSYAAINVLGLTVGIASCLLICLYIQDELSYDRFHTHSDRIYRIDNEMRFQTEVYKTPAIPPSLSAAMARDIAGVGDYVRFTRFGNGDGNGDKNESIVRIGQREAGSGGTTPRFFKERQAFAVDPSLFKVFSFRLIKGDPATALKLPYSIVITEEIARKYFKDQDPMGQVITFTGVLPPPANDQGFKVTGVLAPVPTNSHIHFDLLVSMSSLQALAQANHAEYDPTNTWTSYVFYSYLLLDANKKAAEVEKQLPVLLNKYVKDPTFRSYLNPSLIPLTEIHLHSNLQNEIEPNSSLTTVLIFSTVALLILLVAAVNYTNLAIARSVRRAREVGMRKIMGASKKQLINQFLSESVLLTSMATILGVLLSRFLLLGAFNQLVGKQLTTTWLENGFLWGLLLLIILLVGVVSGSYPALYLSSMSALDVLKSNGSGKGSSGTGAASLLRKGLVVFQFVISVVLIIGTWTIYQQLDYIKNKDLGYDKDRILVVPDPNGVITPKINAFKSELKRTPAIQRVTGSFCTPGGLRNVEVVKTETLPNENNLTMASINCDFDYLKTMGIELMKGRDFDPSQGLDSTQSIIINEAAITTLNLGKGPVGKVIMVSEDGNLVRKRIIGVARNINFESLYRKTEASFYTPFHHFFTYLFVRVEPTRSAEAIDALRKTWAEFAPNQPFEYTFLNENLNQLYASEEKLGQVITYFSLLAVLIACLGLFGLASFSIEQRVKEIGIRKVLGASVLDVLLLLSKEYLWLIGIATLIAWPLAYYLINQWMSNFVFHTDIPWLAFLAAGVIVCAFAMITINLKAIRVAQDNPVKSLRAE